ncbi:hypothetical protein PX699_02675 [Sphingobium sp. H39-3-25]|nr:hypothetical protein [Sphingobium arseniciresistens]
MRAKRDHGLSIIPCNMVQRETTGGRMRFVEKYRPMAIDSQKAGG